MALLLIPLQLGFVLSRYWLRRTDWPGLIGQTVGLALVFTLIGVNGFYHLTTLQNSLILTLSVQTIASIPLWLKRPEPPEIVALTKIHTGCLLTLVSIVLFYANSHQIANPDDDFWIHTALQGLIRNGTFPLRNPFFPDIPMNGHYGRNLTVVWLGELCGLDNFIVQHVFTSTTQVLGVLLFFSGFSRSEKSSTAALLGVLCVFFGVNSGGHSGLVDTFQNNNSFAYFYMAIIFDLTMSIWIRANLTSALLMGVCLGSYAIVYETHFGICFLTLVGLTPILFIRHAIDRRKVLMTVLALAIALPIAFTQGGPLTEILQRKVQKSSTRDLSKGMQNQSQVVKIKFPKKNLFQIHLETGEWQRIAAIYRLDTPLKVFDTPANDRGYAYIWSWKVLRIHFLPLYLLPFSFLVLWKRKSLAGLFTGAFGTISFLVPAIVDFGPVYESEYYRWEYASAVGFAGSLGLALYYILPQNITKPRRSGKWILVSKDYFKTAGIIAVLVLNCWACTHYVSKGLSEALSKGPSAWLYFPSSERWLTNQPLLRFESIDVAMAKWLNGTVKPGDRLLTNFSDENSFSILHESTISGISGARCVGHALPLDAEKIGTTPFRRSPPADLFWKKGRPEALKQLQVEWLLYGSDDGAKPPDIPAAKEVHRLESGKKIRALYKIDQSQLNDFTSPPTTKKNDSRQARLQAKSWELRSGDLAELRVTVLENPGAQAETTIKGTLIFSTTRISDQLSSHPQEDIKIQVNEHFGAGEAVGFEVPFIVPNEEGDYTLSASWIPAENSPNLEFESVTLQCRFSQLLAGIQVESLEIDDAQWLTKNTVSPRVLLHPKVTLKLPSNMVDGHSVIACWAFYSEDRQRFDILPAINLRRIELRETIDNLPLVTPETPGEYRLGLYLSPIQGELIRIPTNLKLMVQPEDKP
jgi:hypothetical protein